MTPPPNDFASLLKAIEASNASQMQVLAESVQSTTAHQISLALAPIVSRLDRLEESTSLTETHRHLTWAELADPAEEDIFRDYEQSDAVDELMLSDEPPRFIEAI